MFCLGKSYIFPKEKATFQPQRSGKARAPKPHLISPPRHGPVSHRPLRIPSSSSLLFPPPPPPIGRAAAEPVSPVHLASSSSSSSALSPGVNVSGNGTAAAASRRQFCARHCERESESRARARLHYEASRAGAQAPAVPHVFLEVAVAPRRRSRSSEVVVLRQLCWRKVSARELEVRGLLLPRICAVLDRAFVTGFRVA